MATLIRGDKSKHKFQGKVMPSFVQTNHSFVNPRKHYVFTPGTQSTRQQKRHLRHKCRAIYDTHDPAVLAAGYRIVHAVMHEPDPEYACLHLFCEAIDMADQTGESWAVSASYLMDKFDAMTKESSDDAAPTESDRRVEPQSGFIGTFIRRVFHARHEKGSGHDEYQQSGDANGERTSSADRDPDSSAEGSTTAVGDTGSQRCENGR